MGPVAAALPALGSFVTAAAPYAKAVGTIAGAAGAVKGLAQQPQAGQAAPAPPPVVIEPPPMLIPPPPEEEEEDVEISAVIMAYPDAFSPQAVAFAEASIDHAYIVADR